MRDPEPPRALILATGEDIPRGQSVRARLLILELPKGSIKAAHLTECQRNAHEGLYAEAMGGFVRWLAGRHEEARAAFGQKVSEHRAAALRNTAHARTPEIVANLQAGFEMYLRFAVECGAIDTAERERLASRCWDAFSEAAAAQAKHQAATDPAARFLSTLGSLLISGQAHLEARSGGEPHRAPESCGWRRNSMAKWEPLGARIGWVEEEDLYLDPIAAFRVVQIAGRDVGEVLTVSEQTLKKRLHEKRLLASVDVKRQTLTVRRTIGGSSKDVLHLLRSTLLPEAPNGEETDAG